MLPNAFIGKTEQPTNEEVAAELGPKEKALWDQLLTDLATQFDLTTEEWNSYSPKAGWALRLKRGKRNIVYLGPCHGSFRVSFVLGDKALNAARESGLPKSTLKMLDEAKRYAEGTAVRIDVKTAKDIPIIMKLAKAKLEN